MLFWSNLALICLWMSNLRGREIAATPPFHLEIFWKNVFFGLLKNAILAGITPIRILFAIKKAKLLNSSFKFCRKLTKKHLFLHRLAYFHVFSRKIVRKFKKMFILTHLGATWNNVFFQKKNMKIGKPMEKKVFFFGQFSTKFQGQISKFSFFDQKSEKKWSKSEL